MIDLNLKNTILIESGTLDNGLQVIISPIKKAPVVSINLGYKVGSKNEISGKTGLAHLFEHLMFEGTKNLHKGEFDRLCSMAGGVNNAYTTYDHTAYSMTVPAHQFELPLWLESDRMFNFDITEEALNNQKNVVAEEISQNVENQPYGQWREKLSKSAFSEGHPYSWQVYGSKDDVLSSDLNTIHEFFDLHYRPDNACLAICGDISPEKAYELVYKYFLSSKGVRHVKTQKNVNGLKFGSSVQFSDTVPAPAVFLSFHIPSFLDDTVYCADLLANILGAGRSSRLYKSLVYDLQIASYCGAFADKRELSSLLTIYAFATTPDISPDKLIEQINSEIQKIRTELVSTNEFSKAINQLTTQIGYDLQYSASIADILTNQKLFWDDPFRIYTLLSKYESISLNDLKDFAIQYLNIDKAVRVDAIPK